MTRDDPWAAGGFCECIALVFVLAMHVPVPLRSGWPWLSILAWEGAVAFAFGTARFALCAAELRRLRRAGITDP